MGFVWLPVATMDKGTTTTTVTTTTTTIMGERGENARGQQENHVRKTQQLHLQQRTTTRKTGRLLTWATPVTAGAKQTAMEQQEWTSPSLSNTVLPLLQHPISIASSLCVL